MEKLHSKICAVMFKIYKKYIFSSISAFIPHYIMMVNLKGLLQHTLVINVSTLC